MPSNARSKLDTLDVWWHVGERSVADNLAVDEALLDELEQRPLLRFYQWSGQHGEAWTMGYFQRWSEMPFAAEWEQAGAEHLDIARRWTGGGLVCHRGDRPYTLTVPADHWLAKISATDCYRWIHERLAAAIRNATGIAAVTQPPPEVPEAGPASPSRACFAEPVHWDVVIAGAAKHGTGGEEKKIAGAAQRRSRGRLLHQGSVILPTEEGQEEFTDSKRGWRQAFAEMLCDSPMKNWSPSEGLLAHATQLAQDRYCTREWRQKF